MNEHILQLDSLYIVNVKGMVVTKAGALQMEMPVVLARHKIWVADMNQELKSAQNLARSRRPPPVMRNPILQQAPLSCAVEHVESWFDTRHREAFEPLRIWAETHNVGDLAESAKFVAVLLGEAPKELDVAVFRHMLWQIKRKLLESSSTFEMFLNITGPQGVGKTYAMRKLLGFLGDCYGEVPLTTILDSRASFMHRFLYANMCEELQGADRADVERLKGVITSHDLSYRVLGTNKMATVKQNTTFFGTSNKSVFDSFRDSTGMRRFYELHVPAPIKRPGLAAVDIQAVWNGIDASQSEPIYINAYKDQLEQSQQQQLYMSSFQEWQADHQVKEGDSHVFGSALYEHYKRQCEAASNRPTVRQSFYRELQAVGIQRSTYANAATFLIDQTSALRYFKTGIAKHEQLNN